MVGSKNSPTVKSNMLFHEEKYIQNIYKTHFKKHILSNIQFKY